MWLYLSHLVVSLFFSHIWWCYPHIVQYQHHIWCTFVTFSGSLIFFLTFDSIILTLCSTNITCNCTFVTFSSSFILFFSHIWWCYPHIVQYQHYIRLYFCHIRWFPYFFSHIWWFHCHVKQYQHHIWSYISHIRWYLNFFLTFDSSIIILYNTNIIYDCTFITFGDSLIFFLTFDSSIVTLDSTNVTFDHTFATFGCFHIFFSHLIILSLNGVVPILDVIVLLSRSVVPLFIYLFFFLTFDGLIVTLGSTNIIHDRTFVTINGSFFLFFFNSYLTVSLSH